MPHDVPTRSRPEIRPADAWRSALVSRRTETPAIETIPATQISPLDRNLSRRRFIRTSFWGGLGVTLGGSVGLLVDYLWPRRVAGFGGPVPAGHVTDYVRGAEPVRNLRGQFWIANLNPEDTAHNGTGGGAGLLALWHRCPHLGCTVPWNPRATLKPEISPAVGWYQCPCHGSTYTRAGVLYHGPAERSMDTMLIEIDEAGAVIVQTSEITPGGTDNPRRAMTHPLLPA